MYYLGIAIGVIGVICAFSLLLTFGVIRRMRELSEILAELMSNRTAATTPVGQRVGAFTASTTLGGTVTRDCGSGQRLVGFFSPGCEPCEERIPEFAAYARQAGIAALAIVVADDGGGQHHVERLSATADVVVEPTGGRVSAAFGVSSFPTLCLTDADGVLLAAGNTIAELPALQPA